MVRDGRITDVKTVAAILWVKAFCRSRPLQNGARSQLRR